MPRYTGWRRLSGDGAARPDLLDLGKRLLGYLAEQRRLSGVKTMSIRRQTPDGSTVIARFIGDLPSIEVIANNVRPQALRTISLRAYLYMQAESPRRYLRAVVEIDNYDAETLEFVAASRKMLAFQDAGNTIPRTYFTFVAPNGQPFSARDQTQPQYVAGVLNGVMNLYNPSLEPIGLITNTLWASTYAQPIGLGTETYEWSVTIPATNRILTLGYARDNSAVVLAPVIFSINTDTKLAVAGARLNSLIPIDVDLNEYSVHDFIGSSVTGDAIIARPKDSSGGVVVARITDALLVGDRLDLDDRDGTAFLEFDAANKQLFLSTLLHDGTGSEV